MRSTIRERIEAARNRKKARSEHHKKSSKSVEKTALVSKKAAKYSKKPLLSFKQYKKITRSTWPAAKKIEHLLQIIDL